MKPPIKIQTRKEDKTEFENFVELAQLLFRVPKDKITSKHTSNEQRKNKTQSKTKQLTK